MYHTQSQLISYKYFFVTFIEPTAVPDNVHITASTTTSLDYAWDEIPCWSRGGTISYKYSLDSSPPKTGTTINTHKSVSGLIACGTYEFKVQATNSAGDSDDGSESGETDVESKYKGTRVNCTVRSTGKL